MLTPFQFASNTPIAAIDLDGLEMLIIGNKKFKSQVEGLVKGLSLTKYGRKMLSKISNSGRILIVKDSDEIENYIRGKMVVGVNKGGTYGTDKVRNDILFVDDNFGKNIYDGPIKNQKTIDDSPVGAFAHEIQHFFDEASTHQIAYTFSTFNDSFDNFKTTYEYDGFGNSEINAVHTENIIRSELGLVLRNYYGGLKIRDSKFDDKRKIRQIYDLKLQKYNRSPSPVVGLVPGRKYNYSKHQESLIFKAYMEFLNSTNSFEIDATQYSKPKNKSQENGTLLLFPKG